MKPSLEHQSTILDHTNVQGSGVSRKDTEYSDYVATDKDKV